MASRTPNHYKRNVRNSYEPVLIASDLVAASSFNVATGKAIAGQPIVPVLMANLELGVTNVQADKYRHFLRTLAIAYDRIHKERGFPVLREILDRMLGEAGAEADLPLSGPFSTPNQGMVSEASSGTSSTSLGAPTLRAEGSSAEAPPVSDNRKRERLFLAFASTYFQAMGWFQPNPLLSMNVEIKLCHGIDIGFNDPVWFSWPLKYHQSKLLPSDLVKKYYQLNPTAGFAGKHEWRVERFTEHRRAQVLFADPIYCPCNGCRQGVASVHSIYSMQWEPTMFIINGSESVPCYWADSNSAKHSILDAEYMDPVSFDVGHYSVAEVEVIEELERVEWEKKLTEKQAAAKSDKQKAQVESFRKKRGEFTFPLSVTRQELRACEAETVLNGTAFERAKILAKRALVISEVSEEANEEGADESEPMPWWIDINKVTSIEIREHHMPARTLRSETQQKALVAAAVSAASECRAAKQVRSPEHSNINNKKQKTK